MAEDDFLVREALLDERFEITRMLHTIRNRTADNGDVVVGFQFKFLLRLRKSTGGDKGERGEVADVHFEKGARCVGEKPRYGKRVRS